jgi:hypothetical protein
MYRLARRRVDSNFYRRIICGFSSLWFLDLIVVLTPLNYFKFRRAPHTYHAKWAKARFDSAMR